MNDDDLVAGMLVDLKVLYAARGTFYDADRKARRPKDHVRPGILVGVRRTDVGVVDLLHVRDETDGQILGALRDGDVWRVVMPGLTWPGQVVVTLCGGRSLSGDSGSGSTPP